MIFETLFEGVISVVINLVNFVLSPIDNLILRYLPGLSTLLDNVGSFFQYISNIIPWVVSYLGLSPAILNLIVLTLVFKVSVSFLVYISKLALRWYNYLKL